MAAAVGVPIGLVTGDDVICAVAEKTFPGVVTVPVKTALGRTAISKHPAVAREAIAAGAGAISGTLRPVTVPDELAIEAELRPHGAVELAALVPGTERTGARTVRYQAASPRTALDVLLVWSALTSHYLSR